MAGSVEVPGAGQAQRALAGWGLHREGETQERRNRDGEMDPREGAESESKRDGYERP